MLAKSPTSVEKLVEMAMENAAACIKERALLPSVDWSRAAPAQVARMLDRLAAEGIRLPPWLGKALVLGGHVLPIAQAGVLDIQLRALSDLNEQVLSGKGEGAEAAVGSLIAQADPDPDVIAASLGQLQSLGQGRLAARLALAHWRRLPQSLRRVESDLQAILAELPEARLRVASFSNPHGVASDLVPAFAAVGFRAEVTEADYGQALFELIQPGERSADVLILLLDINGFHPPDWRLDSEELHRLLVERIEQLGSALEHYAEKAKGFVLVNTLPPPVAPTAGLLDTTHPGGFSHWTRLINERIFAAASRASRLLVIDSGQALSEIEPRRWFDPKLWYYGRLPYSAEANRALARAFAGAYRTLKKGTAKVLVLDMDNTLWGGVFGDDGVSSLVCDEEFPGNAFRALQMECLRLKSQGMVLAVLSKNNPDAITVFRDHPGMLLKEEDFVAHRINWEPKPQNVRSIAEELKLGIDSFVFLDDSPHEREAMRRSCPEVIVPEMPADPAARPGWLRSLAATWPIRLTDEDMRRSDMYLAERRRSEARSGAVSFADYLRDLNQTLVVEGVTPATLARAAQMHLRTNQFNLTTERYDDVAIAAMMGDGKRFVVLLGRALDKFGDHGLVICASARIDGENAVIQSFLMSCRVIGRDVEKAFLGELLGELAGRGAARATGIYLPTKKNAQVKDFYRSAGFEFLRSEGEKEIWGFELDGSQPLPASEFIELRRHA